MTAGRSGGRGGPFVGRASELGQLHALAREAMGGSARLAVIEGEPGIGKTAVISALLRELSGVTVLRAVGDPGESALRFAVLSQLLDRGFAELGRQRAVSMDEAIESGMTTVAAGAELLNLLDDLQEHATVVIVVDDAQWIDAESSNALKFAFRRLWADRVLALVLVRSQSVQRDDATGSVAEEWTRLQVGDQPVVHLPLLGLDSSEISQLLEITSGVRPSAATAERLRGRTAGHPLWLSFLFAELPAEVLRNSDAPLPIPRPLASLVAGQRSRLQPASRDLLDALAVLGRRCPVALAGSVAGVENSAEALDEVLAAGLVEWWPGDPSSPVSIKHPLLRDAIYAALDPVRRRQLHAAAAPRVPLDESWHHRVAAADQLDAELTAELEEASGRFLRAGDAGRAATLLEWAAQTTPSRELRERYILAAAGHLLAGQQVQRAEALRSAVENCSPSPMKNCVLGSLASFRGSFTAAEQLLTDALSASLRSGDRAVAAISARALAGLYVWVGRGEQAADAAAQAVAAGSAAPHLETTAKTMQIVGLLQSRGAKGALRDFPVIARQGPGGSDLENVDPYLLGWRGSLHLLSGEIEQSVEDLNIAMRRVEPIPGKQIDVHLHYWLAHAEYLRGNWQNAAGHADRAISFAMADNRVYLYAPCYAVSAMIAAGLGEWAIAEEHARTCRALVTSMGPDHYIVYPALAEATIAQARSDGSAMCSALDPVATRADNQGFPKALQPWWRPLHLEGLILTGALEAAGQALRDLARIAQDVPYLRVAVSWLSGLLAMSRGDQDRARAEYEMGLRFQSVTDQVPLYSALLDLEYARSIISADRRSAIARLRLARDRFTALGAVPFVERTAAIDGSQGGIEMGTKDALLSLTGRERDVAHVVAEGLTNAQAAKAIFVSEKTIEYHLARIYAKLGISTRRDLAAAMEMALPAR